MLICIDFLFVFGVIIQAKVTICSLFIITFVQQNSTRLHEISHAFHNNPSLDNSIYVNSLWKLLIICA